MTEPNETAEPSGASGGSLAEDRLLFRLAIYLKTTVAELKRRMSVKEMTHWISYMRNYSGDR